MKEQADLPLPSEELKAVSKISFEYVSDYAMLFALDVQDLSLQCLDFIEKERESSDKSTEEFFRLTNQKILRSFLPGIVSRDYEERGIKMTIKGIYRLVMAKRRGEEVLAPHKCEQIDDITWAGDIFGANSTTLEHSFGFNYPKTAEVLKSFSVEEKLAFYLSKKMRKEKIAVLFNAKPDPAQTGGEWLEERYREIILEMQAGRFYEKIPGEKITELAPPEERLLFLLMLIDDGTSASQNAILEFLKNKDKYQTKDIRKILLQIKQSWNKALKEDESGAGTKIFRHPRGPRRFVFHKPIEPIDLDNSAPEKIHNNLVRIRQRRQLPEFCRNRGLAKAEHRHESFLITRFPDKWLVYNSVELFQNYGPFLERMEAIFGSPAKEHRDKLYQTLKIWLKEVEPRTALFDLRGRMTSSGLLQQQDFIGQLRNEEININPRQKLIAFLAEGAQIDLKSIEGLFEALKVEFVQERDWIGEMNLMDILEVEEDGKIALPLIRHLEPKPGHKKDFDQLKRSLCSLLGIRIKED